MPQPIDPNVPLAQTAVGQAPPPKPADPGYVQRLINALKGLGSSPPPAPPAAPPPNQVPGKALDRGKSIMSKADAMS
jgi:hypothetical protein